MLYTGSPVKQNLDATSPGRDTYHINSSVPCSDENLQSTNTVAGITHVSESVLSDMGETIVNKSVAITSTPGNTGKPASPDITSIRPSSEEISSPSVAEKVVILKLSTGVQTVEADDVKQLRSDLSACKSEVKTTKRDNEELHRKVAQLRDEVIQLETQQSVDLVKSTKDDNDKLIIKVSALEAGIKVIEQKHEDEKQNLVTKISELEAINNELEVVKVEKQSAVDRICELEAEIRELEAIKVANMEYESGESDIEDPLPHDHGSQTNVSSPPTMNQPANQSPTEASNADDKSIPRRPSWDNDAAFHAFSEPILLDDDYEDSDSKPTQADPSPKPAGKKKKKKRKNVVRFSIDSKTHFQLSNLYHCYLHLYGKTFISREHAYQWEKATFHGLFDEARDILAAPNAQKAMEIGQGIITNVEWDTSMRFTVMEEIQRAALLPGNCDEFREVLLSTKGKSLEEATAHQPWGAHGSNPQNRLGLLLGKLRDEILEKQPSVKVAPAPKKFDNTPQQKDHNSKPTPTAQNDQRSKANPNVQATPEQTSHTVMKKGLIFSDSFGLGVNPRNDGRIWSTAAYPGARVCPNPGSKYPDMVAELQSQLKSEPDDTVLAIGTNDVFTFEPAEFRKKYHELVLTAKAGKSTVTCSGIFHRGDGTYSQVYYSNQTIDKMNEIICDIARDEQCGFIDNNYANGSTCNEPSLDILTNPNDGRTRFLHLKPEAQQAFAFRIAEYIDLKSAVPPPAVVNSRRKEKSSGTRRPYHPRNNLHKQRW